MDVPAVLAEVHGDAVRPGLFAAEGQRHGIGLDVAAPGGAGRPVAGLAQGGRVVDVDAEENHEVKVDQ